MSISSRLRLTATLGGGLLGLATLRCGPPEHCLRLSDCAIGLACVEGACTPDDTASDDAGHFDARIVEASARGNDAAVDSDAGPIDGSAADSGAPTANNDAASPPGDPSDF